MKVRRRWKPANFTIDVQTFRVTIWYSGVASVAVDDVIDVVIDVLR